jgi:hypothetical protein
LLEWQDRSLETEFAPIGKVLCSEDYIKDMIYQGVDDASDCIDVLFKALCVLSKGLGQEFDQVKKGFPKRISELEPQSAIFHLYSNPPVSDLDHTQLKFIE